MSDADDGPTDAPAAPLRALVGLLDKEAAEQARTRARKWREAVNDRMQPGVDGDDQEVTGPWK